MLFVCVKLKHIMSMIKAGCNAMHHQISVYGNWGIALF